MISRLKLLKGAALGTIASLLLVGKAEAQAPTAAIHYQGRLTNPDGSPVNDGSYSVIFRLYGDPTGGSALWQETVSVTTRSGAFATMLGRTSQFPNGLFNRPLWLEIEVNNRVLTPRQELGASPYAMTALGLVDGAVAGTAITNGTITGEKIKDHTITELQLAPGLTVPVGSVISWWGNAAAVPDGWAVCDGHTVSDAASPLNGLALPDLRNKFVRGGTGNARSSLMTGGADEHTLTEAQMPAHRHAINDPGHSHGVSDPGHSHSISGLGWDQGSWDPGRPRTDANSPKNGWALGTNNATTGIGVQSSNTAISLFDTGGGQAFPILPSYIGLIYIVRVR